jgi:DNA-binding PadR family transcriptional regulator
MKELFLTLLASRRAYGYELRQILEHEFGNLLPAINAGQIYTTLARLERDGLVTAQDIHEDSRGKRVYEVTDLGREVLRKWIDTPEPGARLKDDFFMKFVLVAAAGLAEPRTMLERQRREYLQSMRDLDGLLDSRADSVTTELLDLIEQRMSTEVQST